MANTEYIVSACLYCLNATNFLKLSKHVNAAMIIKQNSIEQFDFITICIFISLLLLILFNLSRLCLILLLFFLEACIAVISTPLMKYLPNIDCSTPVVWLLYFFGSPLLNS